MDEIKPTPRNKLLGLLADNLRSGLDFATNEGKNKPMNLLAEVLGLPAIQTTADRLSYGEPLTTGKGFATRLKPDTFDAAVSVLPFAKPMTKGAGLLAEGLRGLEGSRAMPSGGGNQLGAIVWQDIPKRGTREEFKNAVQNNAENFANELRLKGYSPEVTHSGSKAGSSSYVKIPGFDEFRISDHSKGAFNSQFYNHILDNKIADDFLSKIQQAPESTVFENPRSLLDLTASEARPAVFEANKNARDSNAAFSKAFSNSGKYLGNERLLKILERNGESAAPAFNYPQSEVLKLAQQRAALPVSEGGLGLPANNTAMDRANVMFPEKVYHGTNADIKAPSYEFSGKGNDQYGSASLYTATDPSLASGYVKPDIAGGNVMPLRISTNGFIDSEYAKNLKPQEISKIMKASPELDDALWNFGDISSFGKDKVLNDAVKTHASYQNEKLIDTLNTIGNDIFPNSPEALNKAITNTLGIRGVTANTADKGKIHAVWNPDDIRSRFAAFDPWRRNAAIAASMGVAAPDLLAKDNNELATLLKSKK